MDHQQMQQESGHSWEVIVIFVVTEFTSWKG